MSTCCEDTHSGIPKQAITPKMMNSKSVFITLIFSCDDSEVMGKRPASTLPPYAKVRGGKCLRNNYVSAHSKLLWQSAKGHQWLAIPNNIQQGTWRPFCAGQKRLTIDEMREIATAHGGKCA
jgi:hypothetical protein